MSDAVGEKMKKQTDATEMVPDFYFLDTDEQCV